MAAINGLEWMDEQDALDLLRVSSDNSGIIAQLAASIPPYVYVTTGYPMELTAGNNPDELVKQLSRFVLQLWYNPDGTDAQTLTCVVTSMAKSVKALVSSGNLANNEQCNVIQSA